MTTVDHDTEKLTLLLGSKFLRAYLECSPGIQAGVRDMLDVLNDPNTDEDDREMTLFTLADALFPNPHEGKLGIDLAESERVGTSVSGETRQVLEELDRDEATFASRLRDAMTARRVTQEALAAKLGIGQPAISNMLNRQCRPQRKTVLRVADGLGVTAEELWPGWKP
jgi:lambda repressor-like predicted transcriptional regulator